MNRSLCEGFSAALPAARQGEVRHRYVLGLYRLMEDLLARYPELLLEGCSGGGGRFDAGMLYYAPQIWCSDNTDAVARTAIQYGTSFGYPMSAISAHVSVCPNHQTGRVTPLKTRGITAMQGTFGYEMDLSRLSDAEKALVKAQIERFHTHWRLFQFGKYYRLTEAAPRRFAAWEYAGEDEACLAAVFLDLEANATPARIAWKGLDAAKQYALFCDDAPLGRFTGAQLMHGGVLLPLPQENYDAFWYYARVCAD
jgi:alpha-galactosidase